MDVDRERRETRDCPETLDTRESEDHLANQYVSKHTALLSYNVCDVPSYLMHTTFLHILGSQTQVNTGTQVSLPCYSIYTIVSCIKVLSNNLLCNPLRPKLMET